jgi:3-mercaptopyruvate sulfurtransferase SseA
MSRDTVLVSAEWVEEHLNDPKVVLIEVDEDTTSYDKGHIKGAIKLDWKKDLQDPVRRDFVNKEQFEALLSERGVSPDDTVILYGGNNNWFAAYAYWYFKLYGHRDAKLLDGGRKKWELDSRELVEEQVSRPATQYVAQDPDLAIRAFRDEVVDSIGQRNLVDVRSPDEPHPDRGERAVEQGGERGRHVPFRRRAAHDLWRRGRGLRQGHDRVLPDRRAVVAHLVRAARAARPAEREELRRQLDRVRLARGRAGRAR